MCLGGPNHCRVGRRVVSSTYRRVIVVMHAVTCRASLLSFMFIVVASCWSSSGDVESRVSVTSTRAHTP
jgi:hypothetical protein